MRGSLFFQSGLLTYATTRSGPARLNPGQPDRRSPSDGSDAEQASIVAVVARLLRLVDGSFVFQRGIEPVHPTTVQLDVADVIQLADTRNAEWHEILAMIGSVDARFTLRHTVDGDDVVLSPRQWNVLTSLTPGHSVAEAAALTGHSDLEVARATAELAERKLVTPVAIEEPVPEPAATPPAEDATTDVLTMPGTDVPLSERYEYYVNSKGSELREPSLEELGIVLDLTADAEEPAEVVAAPASEPAPTSELARRWRSLRRGELSDEDE